MGRQRDDDADGQNRIFKINNFMENFRSCNYYSLYEFNRVLGG